MPNNLPNNFLAWHYSFFLPEFAGSRPNHIANTLASFNIAGLLKSLFSPYRRLIARGKMSLFDKLSFNLISILIGAIVRLSLVAAGLLATGLVAIFDLTAVIFYFVFPPISFPKYIALKNNSFFESDLANAQTYFLKLSKTALFKTLTLFFEDNFIEIFRGLPQPASLSIKTTQSQSEMILVLSEKLTAFTKYLEAKNIKPKHFKILIDYLGEHIENPPAARTAPLGQSLIYGYTNTLDQLSTELTAQNLHVATTNFELLEKIEKVLLRPQKNNILLVGEAGVGRHSTLTSLASQIQKNKIPSLAGLRIMLLDTVKVAGLSKTVAQIKSDFENILEEAKSAGNIILAIDQIDRLVTDQESRIDLTDVITSMLQDARLPIIGITTIDDFNLYIRPNANFLKLFEKIDIEEPSGDETLAILIGKSLEIAKNSHVSATLEALLEIVEKSSKLISDKKQPEKSIVTLEDAAGQASHVGSKKVDLSIVDAILSQATKTPVGKIQETESTKLKNLETILHIRIIGQDEAIVQIAKAMRRARAEIESDTKPIGSFLFLGPTGVGKTETAKALAEAYFGQEDKMIRLDMSEFGSLDATSRLIGDLGRKTPGQLASLVRDNPFGILLLDEFEKATRDVHNLFLQIIDEGFLTDAFGKKVSFTNIIIIATSNAGAEFIREQVDQNHPRGEPGSDPGHPGGGQSLSDKLIDHVLKQNLFTPELLNRFDAVVVYKPLEEAQVIQIAELLLLKLAKNLKDSKNITMEVNKQLAQAVAKYGFDPAFGARPIQRFIADKIEDEIAKLIISQDLKNGYKIPASTLLKFIS